MHVFVFVLVKRCGQGVVGNVRFDQGVVGNVKFDCLWWCVYLKSLLLIVMV